MSSWIICIRDIQRRAMKRRGYVKEETERGKIGKPGVGLEPTEGKGVEEGPRL